MRRRRLLAAVGAAAGLAGCSGLQGRSGTPEGTLTPAPVPEETPEQTPEPFDTGGLGSAAIGESDIGDRTLAMSPTRYGDREVEVAVRFRERATRMHPVLLEAQLRSRHETTTEIPLEFPPFTPVTELDRVADSPGPEVALKDGDDPSEPQRLYIVPADDSGLAETTPEVERAGQEEAVWRLAEEPSGRYPDEVLLRPGERVRESFHLVAGPEATSPPLGRYETRAGRPVSTGITAWRTSTPGPRVDSRFGDVDVPALPQTSDTKWFHGADAGTRVFLRPGAERVEPPATIGVLLHNHSRERVAGSGWSFHKLDGGSWHDLGPYLVAGVARPLAPGARRDWRLAIAHDGDTPSGGFDRLEGRYGYLGGGRYALAAGSAPEGQPAALFEIEAPRLRVQPTEDSRPRRDGSVVTVRSERPPGDGEAERATVVVEREPSSRDAGTATPTVVGRPDDGPDRLLPEQAMRARGLRNTLPFFTEGVETVRLETTGTVASRTARVVRFGASQGGFRFEGTVYGFRVGAGEAPTEAGADTTATSTPFGRSPAGK